MNQTAASRPFFQLTVRRGGLLKGLFAVVVTAILMEGVLRAGRVPARWIYDHGPDAWDGRVWIYVGLAILFQALLGLIGIALMRVLLPRADANLRWPPRRSLAGLAFMLGIAMGLVMLLADYWPQLFAGAPFDSPYPVDPVDSTGWLAVMASTGLAEETIFRGLLVGGLAVFVAGRLRAGRFEVPLAGVIVALLFGIAHWETFVVDPLHMAVAQQTYAFAWGLIYVWLMEQSKSLLAPVVAHGTSNAVEVGAVMLIAS